MNAFDLRPRGVGPGSTGLTSVQAHTSGLQKAPKAQQASDPKGLSTGFPSICAAVGLLPGYLALGFVQSDGRDLVGEPESGGWTAGSLPIPGRCPWYFAHGTGFLHVHFHFEDSAFEAVRLASLIDF